jgi:tRNA dimethylallyltransferase
MTDPASPTPARSPLVLLVGPTAAGKTETAIRLAETLGGEIISADSRLFYRGMDIGTAKPTPLEQQRVPHHLIDIVNPNQTLSLAVFQDMAREAIAGVQRGGKLPFLVGGTGQYIRAVSEGWKPPQVEPDSKLREALEKIKDERGGDWLHERLKALDPEAAEKIDRQHPQNHPGDGGHPDNGSKVLRAARARRLRLSPADHRANAPARGALCAH